MKINEVARLTGLTKKAIHFYIREELLQPISNMDNGYYEFSPQDIQTLHNISLLRQLGMPVIEIRKMLNNPQMSCYFLHNLLENLRPELHQMMQQVQKLIYLLNTLPPKTDVDFLRTNSLAGQLNFKDQIERIYSLYFHDEHAVITSILIWGSFLNVETTEYRSYLWTRLVDLARSEIHGQLKFVYQYYMALDWKTVDTVTCQLYYITKRTAELTPDTLEEFHQDMLEALRRLSKDQELMERWKLAYHKILLPLTEFCHKAFGFISEYNASYLPYQQNTSQCCQLLLQDFKNKEKGLLHNLEESLAGMLDLTSYNSSILSMMYSFAQQPFSILPQNQVRKLLEST